MGSGHASGPPEPSLPPARGEAVVRRTLAGDKQHRPGPRAGQTRRVSACLSQQRGSEQTEEKRRALPPGAGARSGWTTPRPRPPAPAAGTDSFFHTRQRAPRRHENVPVLAAIS